MCACYTCKYHFVLFRYAQIFGTLQAYSHWLSQLYLSSLRQPDQPQLHDLVVSLVTTIADSAIPLLSHEVPEKIALSSCQLLLSVINTVRPKFLLSLPSVQKLMERGASEALEQLPIKVHIHACTCTCICMYWCTISLCTQFVIDILRALRRGCHTVMRVHV